MNIGIREKKFNSYLKRKLSFILITKYLKKNNIISIIRIDNLKTKINVFITIFNNDFYLLNILNSFTKEIRFDLIRETKNRFIPRIEFFIFYE